MFHADITFVLTLLALIAGAFLVFSTKIHKEISTGPCKAIGYLVVILSVIMLFISGYALAKGYMMKRQMSGMMQQGKMMPMMQKMMKKPGAPMMKDKMPSQGQMEPKASKPY